MRSLGIIKYNKHFLGSIFLVWWFLPVYSTLLKAVFVDKSFFGISLTGSALSFITYVIKAFLFLGICVSLDIKLKRKVLAFLIAFLGAVFVNLIVVSYRNYVIVEAFTGLITWIVPICIFSELTQLEMETLIHRWYYWTIAHSFVVVFLFFLINRTAGGISYGGISTIMVANTIILLLGSFVYKWKPVVGGFFCVVDFVLMFIGGSRMPSVAFLITFFYLWLFCKKEKKRVKIVIGTIGCLFLVFFMLNIKSVFLLLYSNMGRLGIESRTIRKFAEDIGNLSILEMAKSSGRGYIWETASKYIVSNKGVPGGFAVLRYLTEGKIYFPHNLFLDMGVMFGIFTIPVLGLIIRKLKVARRTYLYKNFVMCSAFGVYFFCISMTGASFFSDPYGIVFWGMILFFRETNVKREI